MKRLLNGFRFAHTNYVPPVLLPSAVGGIPTFDSELQRLRALGPALGVAILRYFLRATEQQWAALSEPAVQDALLRQASELGPATRELTRVGLESRDRLAERFLGFLVAYWEQAGFREEWERTEALLADAITTAGREIAANGLFSMLGNLRPKVGVDADAGELWVRKEAEEEIVVGEDSRLVLVPSAYLWPHIGLVQEPPHTLALLYPAPAARLEVAPLLDAETLVPLLQALGNETRLRALQLIAEGPRSTQELAPQLGISQAALSKHLRQLAEVGVLEAQRDGYYVLYGLRADRIGGLSTSLQALLNTQIAR
jgi:DNA-binding transcriptional ArsR family regulator